MKRLLMATLVCLLLMSVLPSHIEADRFDIGEKQSEIFVSSTGEYAYHFDSGCWLKTHGDYIDYVPVIFDGNLSTGINHYFGPSHTQMNIEFVFPHDVYINHIILDPVFEGDATSTNINIYLPGEVGLSLDSGVTETTKYYINGTVTKIYLALVNAGTDQFNFNDVIINYTPRTDATGEILDRLDVLESDVESLQENLQDLNTHLDEMNTTLNEMNETQQHMLDNITALWTAYDGLNRSLSDISNDLEELNDTSPQNLSYLEENITRMKADIYDIQNDIADISSNQGDITEIRERMNETTARIEEMEGNITDIEGSMPGKYNDTALLERIDRLESEVDLLRTEMDDLDTTGQKKIVERDPDNTIAYGALGVGLIGMVMAVIALMTRRPSTSAPLPQDEDYSALETEYGELDEESDEEEVARGKAKRTDEEEEELDDVMDRLKD